MDKIFKYISVDFNAGMAACPFGKAKKLTLHSNVDYVTSSRRAITADHVADVHHSEAIFLVCLCQARPINN